MTWYELALFAGVFVLGVLSVCVLRVKKDATPEEEFISCFDGEIDCEEN